MPYITQDKRSALDEIVEAMSGVYVAYKHTPHGGIKTQKEGIKVDGDLNYLLFAFCKRHVKPSYNNYKNFCGELNECVAEIRRELLAPYEDQKKEENGDV